MIQKNPKYRPLYLSDKRYFLITGGRGSGKSFEVSTWANLLTYEANHRILFTRYTMTAAGLSIIPEFVEKIELLEVPHHFEVNRDAIRNKETGSDIIFKGIKTSSGNQTANLKSLQGVSTWILDEAEELEDETTFDKIDLSIRKKGVNNRVILVMNPATKEHWIWQRFFEGYTEYIDIEGEQVPISKHPDICHIHTTYLDNKDNLSDSYLNSIERIKEISPAKYKHVVLGGWLERAEGCIYTNWRVGDFDDSLPYIYGMDFGFTDPTALVKVAVDKKNYKVYVEEMLYKSGLSPSAIIKILDGYVNKNDLIIADYAERLTMTEIWDAGFNIQDAQKGKDSVRVGISRLQDYEIIITPDSQNLIREMNNYAWHDKKSETPLDNGYDHLCDSLRYAFTDLVDDNDFFVA
jgi:phage terminase large subunit